MSGGRRRRTRHLLRALIVSTLACRGVQDHGPERTADSTAAAQVTVDLTVIETTLGTRRWILNAERAVHHTETDVTELVGLTVTFFDEMGEETSVLKAQEGQVDRKRRHLVARCNVTVRSSEGYLLETEVLEWDNERKKILTDEPVRIVQGQNVYTGIGLVSDPGLEKFEILRDFEGSLVEEESDGATNGSADDRP